MAGSLRVGTWNVRGLRAGVDAVAGVIRAEELDVLLVQESGPRRRLQALGDRLGWVVCADPWVFPRRRIKNAVLIRSSPADPIRSRFVRFSKGSLLYPRGALIVVVGDRSALVSIHLGLNGAERWRHATQLLGEVRRLGVPVVIGGDLNAHPDDRAPALIAESFPDVWTVAGRGDGLTMPADVPTARIDALFTSPPIRAVGAWTAGDTVSDHLMVVADLELPT